MPPLQHLTEADKARFFTSPAGWTNLFMLACFLMAALCIFGGVRKALDTRDQDTGLLVSKKLRAWALAKELLTFGFFVFMFWSLESYAHTRTPYYAYSTTFYDLVPRATYFKPWIAGLDTLQDQCTNFVEWFVGTDGGKIPLSVILLEASLTYAALWTAKLLNEPPPGSVKLPEQPRGMGRLLGVVGAQPVFAGLVLVTVDALLDPIVAMGHSCHARPWENPWPAAGNGIGLWHWYTPAAENLIYSCADNRASWQICVPGISSGVNTLAPYFHIPLFNYAAWFGAPIILVALANLAGPVRREWIVPWLKRLYALVTGDKTKADPDLNYKQVILLLFVLVPLLIIIRLAPAQDLAVPTQAWILSGTLLLAVGIFIYNFGEFHTIDKVDGTLVLPVAAGLAIPAGAGLVTGQFVSRPWLMPVAVVALLVGLWLAWLPYRDTLEKFSKLVGRVDRFVRVHYFGFTTLLVLLGASYYIKLPSNGMLLGLLLVAACFHVFAYVSNDVFDLDVDSKNPLRVRSPLVKGEIAVPTALVIAFTTIPISVLTTLLMVDFKGPESFRCLAVLTFAYLAMTFYNWQGKTLKFPWTKKPLAFPLLTDLVQGLAWGSLALYGSLVAAPYADISPPTHQVSIADALSRCWLLGAYGALFIFLINGIHGGLRDLPTDLSKDRSTTAIWLGGEVIEGNSQNPAVGSNWRIALFAHVVHVAMFALVVYFLHRHSGVLVQYLDLAIALTIVLFVLSALVLHGVVAPVSAKRNDWVSWHVFVVLLPPIAMFLVVDPPVTAFKMAVFLSFIVPIGLQEDHIDWLLRVVYKDGGIKGSLVQSARAILPKRKPSEVMPAAAMAGNGSVVDVSVDPDSAP